MKKSQESITVQSAWEYPSGLRFIELTVGGGEYVVSYHRWSADELLYIEQKVKSHSAWRPFVKRRVSPFTDRHRILNHRIKTMIEYGGVEFASRGYITGR